MKIFVLILLLVTLLGLSACGGDDDGVYVVTDRFFHHQMTTIMMEPADFEGRTIRYEGMFVSNFIPQINDYMYFVIRISEDCCGGIPVLGMSVELGDIPVVADTTWVEITGVLEQVYIPGIGEIFRLEAISMVERPEPEA